MRQSLAMAMAIVDFYNYHGDEGDLCAICSKVLLKRKKGRYVVRITQELNDLTCVCHDTCYTMLKNLIGQQFIYNCSRCTKEMVHGNAHEFMPARVYYDNSHDDEIACRDCVLADIGMEHEDIAYDCSCHLMRCCKRMLADGMIDDGHASKKIRTMEARTAVIGRSCRSDAGKYTMSDRWKHLSNYEGYLIGTYKKHMMDRCIKELMEKVWHPTNFSKWKHLLTD